MADRLYRYMGDRYTRLDLRGALCRAVTRPDGKCICSRLGTMLVDFESGERVNVLRRRLRKVEAGRDRMEDIKDVSDEPATEPA